MRYSVFIFSMLITSFSVAEQQANFAIRSRTKQVYYRYYLIKRLKKPCILLQRIFLQKELPLEVLELSAFEHDDVKTIVQSLSEHKNFAPFFDLWGDFCSYKRIYDVHFQQEFVMLVHMIYSLLHHNNKRSFKRFAEVESMLHYIDSAVDGCCNRQKRYYVCQEDRAEVTTDDIAKRFYALKRLEKSISLLKQVRTTKLDFTVRNGSFLPLSEIESFHNDRVRESVIQMCTLKQIEPLVQLCKEAQQYRFTQDDTFLQELLMQIFLVYKTMLLKHSTDKTGQVVAQEIEHVLALYEHISSMPLEESLEAIDEVTDRLIALQNNKAPTIQVRIGQCIAWLGLPAAVAIWYFMMKG